MIRQNTSIGQISGIVMLAMLVLVLDACSPHRSFIESDDYAPAQNVDIHKIANAKPRYEPRSARGNPKSYDVNGQTYYVMTSNVNYVERGTASWYGSKFHGRLTSSGDPYNMYAMTAAHKTLPLPTYARVTNLQNGKSIIVKINDRGPFVNGRIIDLSYVAAQKLEITKNGTGYVEVRAITPGYQDTTKTATVKSKPAQIHPASYQHKSHGSNLYLQVGIFDKRDNAEQLSTKLSRLPIPDIRVTRDISNSQPRYRVRIGPVNGDHEADQLIKMLARQGIKGFRIRVD